MSILASTKAEPDLEDVVHSKQGLSSNARALVSEAFFRSKICTGSTVFLLGNVLQLQDLKPQFNRLYACSPAPKLEQITMILVLAVPVIRNTALCVACPCIPGRLRAKPLVTCCAVTVGANTGRRKRLKANGLNFVVDDQGPTDATPVVLLHGFPNRANLWVKQVRLKVSAMCTSTDVGKIQTFQPQHVARH